MNKYEYEFAIQNIKKSNQIYFYLNDILYNILPILNLF